MGGHKAVRREVHTRMLPFPWGSWLGQLLKMNLRWCWRVELICAFHCLGQAQRNCVPLVFSFKSHVFKFLIFVLELMLGSKILEDKFITPYELAYYLIMKIGEQRSDKVESNILKR